MKKSLVLVLVAVMSLVSVESQAKWFGIKAGANISSLNDAQDNLLASIKSAANFQGGVAFNFGFGQKKIVSLQPEVLLSFRDATVQSEDILPGVGDIKLSTTRLEVPVNLQAGLNIGKLARVFIQAGPYFSYVLSDNTASIYDTFKAIPGISQEQFDLNKFEWGIGVGAGVEIFSFQLSAKYDFGINELKAADFEGMWAGMKDRNFSISLAWFFL